MTKRRVEGVMPDGPVVGMVLVAVAAIVLISAAVPDLSRYQLVAIGAVCLVGFALTREYGLAIAAGVTGGGGTGLLIITAGADPASAGYFLLGFAGGFAAIWLLGLLAAPSQRHPWPLVPAAVIGLVGGAISAGRPELINWVFIAGAVVFAVVGAGLLLRRSRASSRKGAGDA